MSENLVTHAVVVAGVVLERDKKFLLVQEKQSRAYGLWNLPAGRVDVGDTIEETAVKEAKEESGFDVTLTRKLGIFHESATDAVKHAFLGEITDGELRWPKDEILDAQWFSLEEIEALGD